MTELILPPFECACRAVLFVPAAVSLPPLLRVCFWCWIFPCRLSTYCSAGAGCGTGDCDGDGDGDKAAAEKRVPSFGGERACQAVRYCTRMDLARTREADGRKPRLAIIASEKSSIDGTRCPVDDEGVRPLPIVFLPPPRPSAPYCAHPLAPTTLTTNHPPPCAFRS